MSILDKYNLFNTGSFLLGPYLIVHWTDYRNKYHRY